jgi:hypothetical protein
MTDERVCLESPVFPLIAAIALLVERQADDGAVYIFPFTGEDMAITRLRGRRWRKRIHRNSPMNRRFGASCREQRANEQDGATDVP